MNDRIRFSGKNNTASSQKFRKNGISFTSKGGGGVTSYEKRVRYIRSDSFINSPLAVFHFSFCFFPFCLVLSSIFCCSFFICLLPLPLTYFNLSVFFNYFHFQRLEQTLILGILATSAFSPLTVLTGQQRDATQTANETPTLWSFRTQAANYFAASLLFRCQ